MQQTRFDLMAVAACALMACGMGLARGAPSDAGAMQASVPLPPFAISACGPMPPVPQELSAFPKGQRLTVKLRLTLSPTGEVNNVRVVQTSNNSAFDMWATRAVAAWKCPASQRTTDVEAEIPLSFIAN